MNENIYGELESSIQAKIEQDNDFQSSIESLTDEEREEAIKDKRLELLNVELAQLKKNGELAKNYKIRAEKAEQELKGKPKEQDKTKETGELSQLDTIAILRANVHEDDIEKVVRFAKLENIEIKDALKHEDLIALLERSNSKRKSAEATSTNTQRRSTSKQSDADLLEGLKDKKIPAPGSEEAERLFFAKRGIKR